MRKLRVRDVMTNDVITAAEDTLLKDIVALIANHDIGAVPITDDQGRLLGVVAQEDLLPIVFRAAVHGPSGERTSGAAPTEPAGEVMDRRPVTVTAETELPDAIRAMRDAAVGRLLVTDESGRLTGIVSRVDLLRLTERPDAAIRDDVATMLYRVLGLGRDHVRIEVDSGLVTLTGTVDRRSTAAIAVRRAGEVAGVLGVDGDALRSDFDDDALLRLRTPWLDLHARAA